MRDFLLFEELIETRHFFLEFDDVVDDEKSSVSEERIGELKKVDGSFLLTVYEYHIE